jgi:hypothetical protein
LSGRRHSSRPLGRSGGGYGEPKAACQMTGRRRGGRSDRALDVRHREIPLCKEAERLPLWRKRIRLAGKHRDNRERVNGDQSSPQRSSKKSLSASSPVGGAAAMRSCNGLSRSARVSRPSVRATSFSSARRTASASVQRHKAATRPASSIAGGRLTVHAQKIGPDVTLGNAFSGSRRMRRTLGWSHCWLGGGERDRNFKSRMRA